MTLALGTHLGPYEILAPLGVGGMGEVYRARDGRLGRDVAVKVLPDAVARDPDRLARFEREARTVAGLNHPNIVVLHSIEEEAGVRFITMELVDGESLDRYIVPKGLPLPRLLELSIPLAEGPRGTGNTRLRPRITRSIDAKSRTRHSLGFLRRMRNGASSSPRPTRVAAKRTRRSAGSSVPTSFATRESCSQR